VPTGLVASNKLLHTWGTFQSSVKYSEDIDCENQEH